MKRTKKPASKKITKRPRVALAPIDNDDAKAQLHVLKAASAQFLKVVNDETSILPVGHIRKTFGDLARAFRSTMKSRKVDPIEKRKTSLKKKISNLQLELETILNAK